LLIFQKNNQSDGRKWTIEEIKRDFELIDIKGAEIINFIDLLDDLNSINLKGYLFKKYLNLYIQINNSKENEL
jgi:hypothetical protein